MTIEELLKEARAKGLYLNNLFELPKSNDTREGSGQWQANFRHLNGWYDFGRGDSAISALQDAFDRCRGAKGPENRPIPKSAPVKPREDDLLGDDEGSIL